MNNTLLQLIWLHFIADFILQTDKMALNKSKSSKWLGVHVLVYSLPFLVFGWQYALVNGAAHFLTDFMSSRATTYLYAKGKRKEFFMIIGLDQAIHLTTLLATIPLMK